MSESGAEMSSLWVEVVAEDDQSDRREFEIKMKTETRSAMYRNKVIMQLSKFLLDQRLITRGYPIGQLLDNCLIFSQSANGFVRYEPNVHQLKGSRIRIIYPLWNKILNQMSHRTETPEVVKRHYLPILKIIPFEMIPKDRQSFVTFVREETALGRNPRPETINVIWKFVEEAIKKCDLHREANQTAGTTNDNATDSSSSGATSSGTDAEIRSDANEPPVVSTSSQSSASESSVTINDMRKNGNKRIANRDHDNHEAERKRQKKADDLFNYNFILSLSQCLGQSSVDIWKRVSYKLITEYGLTDMTETETKMRFEELKTTYLRVLKTAVSPFEASLEFGPGFDLLNVTDLRSVVTNDVHDMIIEFKARLYPTPAVKDEVDIKVIKIDDDDSDNNCE